jgi:predicted metal-binding membrane protein
MNLECCFTEGQRIVVVVGSVCGIVSFFWILYLSIRIAVEKASESDYTREQRSKNEASK